jgi:hypothetical protein
MHGFPFLLILPAELRNTAREDTLEAHGLSPKGGVRPCLIKSAQKRDLLYTFYAWL